MNIFPFTNAASFPKTSRTVTLGSFGRVDLKNSLEPSSGRGIFKLRQPAELWGLVEPSFVRVTRPVGTLSGATPAADTTRIAPASPRFGSGRGRPACLPQATARIRFCQDDKVFRSQEHQICHLSLAEPSLNKLIYSPFPEEQAVGWGKVWLHAYAWLRVPIRG